MSPSIKELTAKEVSENQKKLQISVSQLDAQINSIHNRWSSLEKFVKRWWPLAVGIFSLVVGIITGTAWWINNIETKDNVNKVEQRLNRRIDSLIRHLK